MSMGGKSYDPGERARAEERKRHWLDERAAADRKVDSGAQVSPALSDPDPQRYKADEGKPRWSLMPVRSLRTVLDVLEFGAGKYAPRSWRTVEHARERYTESLMRHAAAVVESVQEHGAGGLMVRDAESGRLHLAHLGATAVILIDLVIESGGEP